MEKKIRFKRGHPFNSWQKPCTINWIRGLSLLSNTTNHASADKVDMPVHTFPSKDGRPHNWMTRDATAHCQSKMLATNQWSERIYIAQVLRFYNLWSSMICQRFRPSAWDDGKVSVVWLSPCCLLLFPSCCPVKFFLLRAVTLRENSECYKQNYLGGTPLVGVRR